MAQPTQQMLPSSQGGLIRYYDEYKSKYQLQPKHVLVLAIGVIIIEIILHSLG